MGHGWNGPDRLGQGAADGSENRPTPERWRKPNEEDTARVGAVEGIPRVWDMSPRRALCLSVLAPRYVRIRMGHGVLT